MPVSLTDKDISDTYTGLLHSQGTPLSSTGRSTIYDGSGQESSLSIGLTGEGITVTGEVSCNRVVVEDVYSENVTCSVGIASPNAPKAWVLFNGFTGAIFSQHNIENVNRNSIGDYTITFTSALSSNYYVAVPTIYYNNSTPDMVCAHIKSSPAPSNAAFSVKTLYLNGAVTTVKDFDSVGVVIYHL